MRNRPLRTRATLTVLAVGLTLAGCGAGPSSDPGRTPPSPEAGSPTGPAPVAPDLDPATRSLIASAAARSMDSRTADIVVEPYDDLDRDGCAFLLAYDPYLLDSFPLYYALLPDGRVAGVDIKRRLRGDGPAACLRRAGRRDLVGQGRHTFQRRGRWHGTDRRQL